MMNKLLKSFMGITLSLCMAAGLLGCGSGQTDKGSSPSAGTGTAAEAGGETAGGSGETFIRNTSSSMSGIWYPMATAMNTIWQKNIDGVGCKVIPGNSSENVKLVAKGETEVAWCHSVGIMDAYAGKAPFDDGLAYQENIAHIATIHPAAIHIIVREGSGIESLGDLNGKVVGFGSIGSTLNAALTDLLALYGITEETIVDAGGTVLNVSNSESATLIQDGQIDVYFSQSVYPSTDTAEIENQVKFIGVEEEKLAEFLKTHENWKEAIIPDGTYANQDGDLHTFSSYVLLACRANLDEELVYQMTKTMWENLDNIHAVSADAKRFMSLDGALTCADIILLHPGAERYYKEIGAIQ